MKIENVALPESGYLEKVINVEKMKMEITKLWREPFQLEKKGSNRPNGVFFKRF
ncbi:hypothetical protein LOS20_15260 [Enterococcus faecium]|nr:hypothetical protein [Enterococcus faecium]